MQRRSIMKRYTKAERRELKRARIAIRENRRVYLHELRKLGLCEADHLKQLIAIQATFANLFKLAEPNQGEECIAAPCLAAVEVEVGQ